MFSRPRSACGSGVGVVLRVGLRGRRAGEDAQLQVARFISGSLVHLGPLLGLCCGEGMCPDLEVCDEA
jgi:hypothetical protein